MIKVSNNAKSKIAQLMTEGGFNAESDYVRVGVKSGGCSGLSYELDFDNAMKDNDKLFEDNFVKIVVDKKSFLYLIGTTLIIQTQIELVDVEKVFLYNYRIL